MNFQMSLQSFWLHGLDFLEHTFFGQQVLKVNERVDHDHNFELNVQTEDEEMESMDDATETMDSSDEGPEFSPEGVIEWMF